MIHLHDLPADQIEREIVALRSQIAAVSPPASMLQASERDRLQLKLMQLQDELTRREHTKYSGGRRARRLKYSWRGTPPKSVVERINREAEKRPKRALELETA